MNWKIKKLSPQLIVSNIERAIQFYTKQLGFELDFRFEDFYAGIVKDGFFIHLKLGQPELNEIKTKREKEDLDIVFSVDLVDELYHDLTSKSIEITQPLIERDYGKEFHIADPDGNFLAFVEEPV